MIWNAGERLGRATKRPRGRAEQPPAGGETEKRLGQTTKRPRGRAQQPPAGGETEKRLGRATKRPRGRAHVTASERKFHAAVERRWARWAILWLHLGAISAFSLLISAFYGGNLLSGQESETLQHVWLWCEHDRPGLPRVGPAQ
jgi:hypothetical protein